MRLLIALVFTALLLAAFGWWLRRAYRQAPPALRPWLLPALGWRLLFTAAGAYWPSQDALHANYYGRAILAQLWARPAEAFAILQAPRLYDLAGRSQEVYRWSHTLFFNKLLALLGLATDGALWINTLWLSLGCFVACWTLVRTLRQVLPAAVPEAALLAFLLWPTVLWWTGGLNKETIVIATGVGTVASVLPLLYGGETAWARPWWCVARRLLAALVLAWVMTRMRYFFALPLLGGLLALAGVQLATRRGWLGTGGAAQVGALLLLLLLPLGLAQLLGGELMQARYFVREVNLNYHHGLLASTARPHIEYTHWQPSVAGLLRHAPLATLETLTRPWLGESGLVLYLGASLENALLTALALGALLAVVRGRPGPLPAALVAMLVLYCLLLAAFIGLSTPNLGTLNRYRSVLLPWLLWLVLQWVPSKRWKR